jgi:hypothetical protein
LRRIDVSRDENFIDAVFNVLAGVLSQVDI